MPSLPPIDFLVHHISKPQSILPFPNSTANGGLLGAAFVTHIICYTDYHGRYSTDGLICTCMQTKYHISMHGQRYTLNVLWITYVPVMVYDSWDAQNIALLDIIKNTSIIKRLIQIVSKVSVVTVTYNKMII